MNSSILENISVSLSYKSDHAYIPTLPQPKKKGKAEKKRITQNKSRKSPKQIFVSLNATVK